MIVDSKPRSAKPPRGKRDADLLAWLDGDPILVIPENARQLHRAVRELILQAESEIAPTPARTRPTPANLAALTRRGDQLVTAFRRLYKRAQLPADRALILEAIRRLNHSLAQIH